MEHTAKLLKDVAEVIRECGIPWDPFNLTLVVRAHNGPKQFYTPSDL
jgi:hypothetical protein